MRLYLPPSHLTRLDKSVETVVLQRVAVFVETLVAGLQKEAAAQAATEIQALWMDFARRKITDGRHLREYLAGMVPVEINGDRIRLRLRGFSALKTEFGWAPPQDSTSEQNPDLALSRGLGTYSGALLDMRPMLLDSGKPARTRMSSDGEEGGRTKSGATRWKFIKLGVTEGNAPITGEAFIDHAVDSWLKSAHTQRAEHNLSEGLAARVRGKKREHLKDQVVQARAADARNAEVFRKGMEQAIKLSNRLHRKRGDGRVQAAWSGALGPPGDEHAGFPRSYKTVITDERTGQTIPVWHKEFFYQKLFLEPIVGDRKTVTKSSSFKLFTLRTISDSDEQLQEKRWFTKGTPPTNILRDPDFLDAVVNVLVNKGITSAKRKTPRVHNVRLKAPSPEPQTAAQPTRRARAHQPVANANPMAVIAPPVSPANDLAQRAEALAHKTFLETYSGRNRSSDEIQRNWNMFKDSLIQDAMVQLRGSSGGNRLQALTAEDLRQIDANQEATHAPLLPPNSKRGW